MADTLTCHRCESEIDARRALEDRCECGDHRHDHHGDDACRVCGCGVFEWDGTLSCPRCLGSLDDLTVVPRRHRTSRAA
ncbi:MAG TPA: hypothetical protein VM618_12140 [Acidimicrobiia bacterium]|nr:hypothetical protein [Acidimicrobiia bacterium]